MSRRHTEPKKRSRIRTLWKRWGDWRKLAVALVTGIFIAFLLTIELVPDEVAVMPGAPAAQDIFAPRHARYQDPQKTQLLRRFAAAQVARIYSNVASAPTESRQGAVGFFTSLAELSTGAESTSPAQKLQHLLKTNPNLSIDLAKQALRLSPEQIRIAEQAAEELVERVMRRQITADDLPDARSSARSEANRTALPEGTRRLVGEIVARNLVPNRIFNERETEAEKQREMARVPIQYETVNRGDLILRKGDLVSPDHLVKLRELGLIRDRIDLVTAASLAALAFGLVAVFSLYLLQFHPRILRSFSNILLISVVVCGSLLVFRIVGTALGLRFSSEQLGYLGTLCAALGAMLIAALLCPQTAVFVGVSLGLLTSVLVGSDLRFAILSIVSSLVAVQCVARIRNRADIVRAAVIVSAVNVATTVVAHGATMSTLPDGIGAHALWSTVVGSGSVLLFVFFAALLERMFRLTTHLTLLELSDHNNPLLRRLEMEAPGTYQHSIVVGNLSESAADAIGADSLFCRVASYYHDVGKIVRPHFFVENQVGESRHSALSPSLSALIVTSHVKDGVELAEEHRLPPPIINIIREHHGTCLIKYFFHQAVTSGGESVPALEYQFRYDGPRPQSKESGIIMLADSAEAASRTLQKPTPSRVRDLIERIVRDRLADGQLDECELTFRDLEKIIAAFTRSLSTRLHARVEYPVGDTMSLRRLAADGAARKEPVEAGRALADTPEAATGASFNPTPS